MIDQFKTSLIVYSIYFYIYPASLLILLVKSTEQLRTSIFWISIFCVGIGFWLSVMATILHWYQNKNKIDTLDALTTISLIFASWRAGNFLFMLTIDTALFWCIIQSLDKTNIITLFLITSCFVAHYFLVDKFFSISAYIVEKLILRKYEKEERTQ